MQSNPLGKIFTCYHEGFALQGPGVVFLRDSPYWDFNPLKFSDNSEILEYQSLEQLRCFQNTPVKLVGTGSFSDQDLLQIIQQAEFGTIYAKVSYKAWPFGRYLLVVIVPKRTDEAKKN